MKTMKYILAATVPLLIASACSQADSLEGHGTDMATSPQSNQPFLADGETPEVKVFKEYELQPHLKEITTHKTKAFRGGEDVDIYVRLTNRSGQSIDNWISDYPADPINDTETFYTNICNKKTLVVVAKNNINTDVSAGTAYSNALFDPATGEWITTFRGGQIVDRDTGKVIDDTQKAIFSKLKAGIAQHCPEILDPNNSIFSKKAGEWLLNEAQEEKH